jgi:P4 family phage/plasmid primase-like protien
LENDIKFPSHDQIKQNIESDLEQKENEKKRKEEELRKKDIVFSQIDGLNSFFTQDDVRLILAQITDKPKFEQKKYLLELSKKTGLSQVELRNECVTLADMKEAELDFTNMSLDEVRQKCYVYVSQQNPSDLTEFIVNWIKSFNHIYSTQNDQNIEVWVYDAGCYYPNGKTKISALVRKATREFYNTVLDKRVLAKIEADTFIDEEEFYNQKNVKYIPVQNGLLDLENKELLPFDPKMIFFNKLPILYDEKAECPTINKFLREISPDNYLLLEEIAGYLLHKDYPLHNWFLFNGKGRNGKGAYIRLLQKFVGLKNFTNVTLQDLNDEPYSLGEIHGKLLNAGGDIPSTTIETTGNIKSITGGDTVNAKRKFKTDLQMKPYAKHIFSANEIPDVKDTSDGFFDRVILVEFNQRYFKPDEYAQLKEVKPHQHLMDAKVEDVMETELSGFLNLAVNGLHRLLENKQFSYSLTMEQTKLLYLRKSNNVVAFFQDCCMRDKDSYVTKEDFRASYQEWCMEEGLDNQINSDKQIFQTLVQSLGISSKRKLLPVEYIGEHEDAKLEKVSIWQGLKLKKGGE